MDREVEIDKGSNKHLEWSETLYEDDEHITYLECGLGEVLKTMPGIDDDIEKEVEKKNDKSKKMSRREFFLFFKPKIV